MFAELEYTNQSLTFRGPPVAPPIEYPDAIGPRAEKVATVLCIAIGVTLFAEPIIVFPEGSILNLSFVDVPVEIAKSSPTAKKKAQQVKVTSK